MDANQEMSGDTWYWTGWKLRSHRWQSCVTLQLNPTLRPFWYFLLFRKNVRAPRHLFKSSKEMKQWFYFACTLKPCAPVLNTKRYLLSLQALFEPLDLRMGWKQSIRCLGQHSLLREGPPCLLLPSLHFSKWGRISRRCAGAILQEYVSEQTSRVSTLCTCWAQRHMYVKS